MSFIHPSLADVVDVSSTAANSLGDTTGEEIVVTGEKLRSQASAGTKTDTPLIETPQSISVISNQDIATYGLENLNQSLRYVAGVTPEQRGAAAEVYDQFALRGFTVPRYLDGLRLFTSPTGYADPQVDVSRIDRIEIIKGPASVLYGQSSPGGLVAIDSKLPLDRPFYGAVAGTYGNDDLYRVDADVGGRSGIFGYRIYGSVNGAHTQQTFGKRRRQAISGAVTIGEGGSTSLTLLGVYSHDPYNGNYSVSPASGTLFANPNGKVSTKFTGSEPGDRFKREQAAGTYIFTHHFGSDWSFRALGRYQQVTSSLGIYYVSGFPTDVAQRIVPRSSYSTREKLDAWTFDNQISGKVTTRPITHTLLFGVDRSILHASEDFAFGSATSIDIFDPVYGTSPTIAPGDTTAVPDAFAGSYKPRLRQTGIYGQDQLAWGRVRLTVSGRYDWARTSLYGDAQNDKKFSYRVGGLYLLPFGLAPYASYSTSFEPQIGAVSDDGGATARSARPSIGRQIEAGLKYQPPGTQILITAAYFDIKQSNLLTSVSGTNYSLETASAKSRGFELEGSAPLPYGFKVRVAFSQQKFRPFTYGVGKGNITGDLEWAAKAGTLDGLSVGGTVRYVDKIYAGAGLFTPVEQAQGYFIPAYTIVDARLGFDLGKAAPRFKGVTAQVNVANLFDKKYLTSCYLDYVGWCWYGNRRTVRGTIAYTW